MGVVMLWAIDFLPLWKKVSGVQILLASKLFRGRRCIGPWKLSLSSFQLWRKNTSIVYSWKTNVKVHYFFYLTLLLTYIQIAFLMYNKAFSGIRRKGIFSQKQYHSRPWAVPGITAQPFCGWGWAVLLHKKNIATAIEKIYLCIKCR